MIDSPNSEWGGTGHTVSGQEGGAWHQLLRNFSLVDTFSHRRGHLLYSWDSMCMHQHNPVNDTCPPGDRILRHLDRIYVAQCGTGPAWECTSNILPRFAFSDHAPVWADLQVGIWQRRPFCHKMNPTDFSNATFKERITTMWEAGVNWGITKGWPPTRTFQKYITEARKIDCC